MLLEYEKEEDIAKTSTQYYAWDEPCKGDKKFKFEIDVKGEGQYKKAVHTLKPDQIGLLEIFTLTGLN
jgi:hypothetical protein